MLETCCVLWKTVYVNGLAGVLNEGEMKRNVCSRREGEHIGPANSGNTKAHGQAGWTSKDTFSRQPQCGCGTNTLMMDNKCEKKRLFDVWK